MSYNQYTPAGFRLLPLVVKNLLIINGLFYLATLTMESTLHIDPVRFLGLHYFESEYFQPYQYVTYMFLHAGFGHLFYNMFALWMFGYLLENVWGSKRFLSFYMVTGIGAALVQTLVNWLDFSSLQQNALLYADQPTLNGFVDFVQNKFPNYYDYHDTIRTFISQWTLNSSDPSYGPQSVEYINQLIRLQMDVPTIGASGAVYGILLAFGMMFPNMLVYFFFLIPLKAKWLVIAYGAIEIFSGISRNPSDNVAHFAHLGGMIFGFFMILYWKKKAIF